MFYFHGFPGSRLEASLLDENALDLGARVIGIDRPGYGCSDERHGRRLEDWPKDVLALADALGFRKFGIIGVSGGGPYALASAAQLKDRITSTTIVCGLGPLCDLGGIVGLPTRRRVACRLLRFVPWLIPFISGRMRRRLAETPEDVFKYLLAEVPEPDRLTLAQPENWRLLQDSFHEAVRRGATGIASDALLYLSRWGFDPRSIAAPVTLWHGEKDRTVPARMSRELADVLPRSELQILPEEGHYSLPFRYHREILESALAA